MNTLVKCIFCNGMEFGLIFVSEHDTVLYCRKCGHENTIRFVNNGWVKELDVAYKTIDTLHHILKKKNTEIKDLVKLLSQIIT